MDEVMGLYCDIAQLDVMSNLEIDSAKRENPANNTLELKALKEKYDVRDVINAVDINYFWCWIHVTAYSRI